MRQTNAHCDQLEMIGGQVRAHFKTDLALVPGQFALARLTQTFDPYLRQPFFPSLIEPDGFAVDFATTDPALRFISPGATIDLLGPVGSAPANIPPRPRLLLVAERDPAALLPFANRAIEAGGTATLLLAGLYPLDALQPEIELQRAELNALPGLAAELAALSDFIVIQTGPQLLQSIYQHLNSSRAFIAAQFAYALVAGPMPCGVGACGACFTKTMRGWKMACTNGPFFPLADLNT